MISLSTVSSLEAVLDGRVVEVSGGGNVMGVDVGRSGARVDVGGISCIGVGVEVSCTCTGVGEADSTVDVSVLICVSRTRDFASLEGSTPAGLTQAKPLNIKMINAKSDRFIQVNNCIVFILLIKPFDY